VPASGPGRLSEPAPAPESCSVLDSGSTASAGTNESESSGAVESVDVTDGSESVLPADRSPPTATGSGDCAVDSGGVAPTTPTPAGTPSSAAAICRETYAMRFVRCNATSTTTIPTATASSDSGSVSIAHVIGSPFASPNSATNGYRSGAISSGSPVASANRGTNAATMIANFSEWKPTPRHVEAASMYFRTPASRPSRSVGRSSYGSISAANSRLASQRSNPARRRAPSSIANRITSPTTTTDSRSPKRIPNENSI